MSEVTASEPLPRGIVDTVGEGFVRGAGEGDAVDGVAARFVVEPGTAGEVPGVLAAASAAGLSVVPRGGGTKIGWGAPPRSADVVLSLRRLGRVLEHAAGDMTVTVEAGCTIAALQRTLAERGQRLALDPLWPERATVGGVLATADSGSLRAAFGAPRDLVLGVTVALADGTLARSGGKVVKNVAGYDLPKLFTGSFGTLGVITQATFRLHPLPGAVRDLCFELPTEAIGRFVAAMGECSLLVAGAQLRIEEGGAAVACVRIESLPDAIDGKAGRVERAVAETGGRRVVIHAAGEWGERERLFEGIGADSLVAKVAIPPSGIDELLRAISETARVAGPEPAGRGPEGATPVEGVTRGAPSVRGHGHAPLSPATRVVGSSVAGTQRWRFVAQAYGIGLLRVDAERADGLVDVIGRLRSEVSRLGGLLAVLEAPRDVKSRLDVWGEAGDTLPLMRRVKQQFDPAGTLNPGRFVGGI